MQNLGDAIQHMNIDLDDSPETLAAAKAFREKQMQGVFASWEQKKRDLYYRSSLWGQPTPRAEFNFTDWQPELQPNQSKALEIKQTAYNYAKELFKSDFNVTLFGTPGTGKTALAMAIFTALSKQRSVMFVSSVELKQLHMSYIETRDVLAAKRRDEVSRAMAEVDVLLLDDFGKETAKQNPIIDEYLFKLADARQGKTTIITTNYTIDNLEKKYDLAVLDRLISKKRRLMFSGLESLREV